MKSQLICSIALTLLVAASVQAQSRSLILNEWNCVGDSKQLDGSDSYFGRIDGNGRNWIELVVVEDGLDITGWTLPWLNGDPSSGSITFSDDEVWEELRAGTIITIQEYESGAPGAISSSDVSFAPCAGDWHIHIRLDDDDYVDHTGAFKVDNDDWEMGIEDSSATVVQDPVGENVTNWVGGGISSKEVGKLEANPSASVVIGNYDDGDNSTFGAPNTWGSGFQDFSTLRSWFDPNECP